MSDRGGSEKSSLRWAMECKYERLHHLKRLEDLSMIENPDCHQRELIRLSRQFLDNPIGGSGGRFDLSNAQYVEELDRFAAERNPS